MKNNAGQYLYSVFRQAAQEFRQIGQTIGDRLLRTPLPKILVVVLAIALLITIIPLIITLFIAFVLIRILLKILSMSMRQNQGKDTSVPYERRIKDIH
ncbi:MAG: hypothetical protein HYR68_14490 [Burkholderiales bacterium]|nr:hypothetical protein [Burkholderiales bacterium]MBI3731169.1 hypothetical protein [Burkholderiales bacterium]